MRFLANEDFPADAVTQLKAARHDIVWVRTAAPGMKDEDVLAWTAREARIVLTFNKDFGELAWRAGLPASSGIVLLRLPMPPAAEVGTTLAARIVERTDLAGHFTVINQRVFACARLRQNNFLPSSACICVRSLVCRRRVQIGGIPCSRCARN
jgi:predicted nuclease of predicted toxin-antitoxin system